jgi:hypothetical protein
MQYFTFRNALKVRHYYLNRFHVYYRQDRHELCRTWLTCQITHPLGTGGISRFSSGILDHFAWKLCSNVYFEILFALVSCKCYSQFFNKSPMSMILYYVNHLYIILIDLFRWNNKDRSYENNSRCFKIFVSFISYKSNYPIIHNTKYKCYNRLIGVMSECVVNLK